MIMEKEYDFSQAKRGLFYHKDSMLIPPVHLEPDVFEYLSHRAKERGTSLNALVNLLLKKDIELIESAK
jgi:hypothetical protein